MTPKPTRRRFLATTGSLAVASTVPTASAQSSSSAPPQGILSNGMGEGGDRSAFFRGLIASYRGSFGTPDTAETLADRMRNEFVANSDAWIDYGNWLIDEHDVTVLGSATIAVDVTITRMRWPTRDATVETTINATYDEDANAFTGLDWRLEPAEDPHYQVEIKNRAAEHAADELQSFRRQFIDPENGHELPDSEYVSTIAGKYSTDIGLGEDSRNVLELLLGGEIE
ncbi:hypothetical protein [Halomontanus rarus]|uniref:hypothetical protein n=1 Tax=Halomontanus rarus TaxID=3034020 RepID=UPI00307C219A